LRAVSLRRLVAVGVLAVVAALYVSPVQKYLRVERDLTQQRAELVRTQQRHDALEHQRAALQTTQRIVELARACGWIFPGERPLVVQGLPPRDGVPCR
jgi:cell division protein FtsB